MKKVRSEILYNLNLMVFLCVIYFIGSDCLLFAQSKIQFMDDQTARSLEQILANADPNKLGVLPPEEEAPYKSIQFEDAQLKKTVERTLGKSDPNQLDMLALEELDVSYESIQTLDGLEHALNLKRLDVSYNGITSIEPICEIKGIEELNISGCELTDIFKISFLKQLKRLWAQNCDLTDISFLEDSKSLYQLDLAANLISNLTPLCSLSRLDVLVLENNNVSDISALKNLTNLSQLMLGNNQIENISVLSELLDIEYLILYGNQIRDISSLTNLSQLGTLSLNQNPLNHDSIGNSLPKIWKRNKDNQITVYFNGGEYSPAKSLQDKDMAFSKIAALSPDENYLLFVAGPKGDAIPGLESGGQIFLLSLEKKDSSSLHSVPDVVADLMGGAFGSIGWRNEREFHVLTDMGNSGSNRLFVLSIHNEDGGLKINTEYSKTNSGYMTGLKWSPSGRFLSGNTFGIKKRWKILDYEKEIIRKYDLDFSYSARYCWADDKTLFSCLENQIIRSTLQGIAETERTVLQEGEREACLGGTIKGKPVFAVDKNIYLGQKSLYAAVADVDQLFVGQTQIAFVCENSIGIVDLNGKEIFSKTLTGKERLLAFSEKKGVLYMLTNDRARLESCDILDNGENSTLCTIDKIREIKGVRHAL